MSPNETLFLESTTKIIKDDISNSSFVQFRVGGITFWLKGTCAGFYVKGAVFKSLIMITFKFTIGGRHFKSNKVDICGTLCARNDMNYVYGT